MIPHSVQLQIDSLLFEGLDQIDLTGPFEALSRIPNSTYRFYGKTTRRFTISGGWDGHPTPSWLTRRHDGAKMRDRFRLASTLRSVWPRASASSSGWNLPSSTTNVFVKYEPVHSRTSTSGLPATNGRRSEDR